MDDGQVTYDTLQDLLRSERRSNRLSTVPPSFWADTRALLRDLEAQFHAEQEADPFSRRTTRLAIEVKNARSAAEGLWGLRERKLALHALAADAKAPEGITVGETRLFEELVATFAAGRDAAFEDAAGDRTPDRVVSAKGGKPSVFPPSHRDAVTDQSEVVDTPAPLRPPSKPPAPAPQQPEPAVRPPATLPPPAAPAATPPAPAGTTSEKPVGTDDDLLDADLDVLAGDAPPANGPVPPAGPTGPTAPPEPATAPSQATTPRPVVTVPADTPEADNVMVRALEDLPPFVGPDMVTYQLLEGDVASVPRRIADLLTKRGRAAAIDAQ